MTASTMMMLVGIDHQIVFMRLLPVHWGVYFAFMFVALYFQTIRKVAIKTGMTTIAASDNASSMIFRSCIAINPCGLRNPKVLPEIKIVRMSEKSHRRNRTIRI